MRLVRGHRQRVLQSRKGASMTNTTKRTNNIDTWFVRFLIVATILLLIEAVLMLLVGNSLLLYLFYGALAIVAGELAIHYSKGQHDKIN